MEPGEFEGTLKLKAWTSKSRAKGHGKAVRAFFELDDGRKIIAMVQPFRYEQLSLISAAEIGEKFTLRFEISSSLFVFLAELKVKPEDDDLPEEIV